MQLGILIEEMRREGYEMSLSPPTAVNSVGAWLGVQKGTHWAHGENWWIEVFGFRSVVEFLRCAASMRSSKTCREGWHAGMKLPKCLAFPKRGDDGTILEPWEDVQIEAQ